MLPKNFIMNVFNSDGYFSSNFKLLICRDTYPCTKESNFWRTVDMFQVTFGKKTTGS